MKQFRRVHEFERLEELVHHVLLVYLLQYVGTYDGVQVSLHIVKDEVDVAVVLCLDDVDKSAVRVLVNKGSMTAGKVMKACLEQAGCTL